MPPLVIRNSLNLNQQLSTNPLPNNFTQIPIFTHIEKYDIEDDIDLYSCGYV